MKFELVVPPDYVNVDELNPGESVDINDDRGKVATIEYAHDGKTMRLIFAHPWTAAKEDADVGVNAAG